MWKVSLLVFSFFKLCLVQLIMAWKRIKQQGNIVVVGTGRTCAVLISLIRLSLLLYPSLHTIRSVLLHWCGSHALHRYIYYRSVEWNMLPRYTTVPRLVWSNRSLLNFSRACNDILYPTAYRASIADSTIKALLLLYGTTAVFPCLTRRHFLSV